MKIKTTIRTTFAAIGLVAATISVCQAHGADGNHAVTKAQVQSELAALESVGYDPHRENNYPADLQAAEARLADQHQAKDLAQK